MAQRAIININGDLIPFSEDLDRIRTPGLGGSAVTWVPDADTICDQLKVTANGTYSAAEAGKYGYDYVVVSVPGSSVTGRDPDTGEEVEVHPDPETGEIVTTVLPTEIRVITPPAKTDYADGETIDYSGIVVHAYSSTGEDMGAVPFNELVFPVTTAQGGDEWSDGQGLNAKMLYYRPEYYHYYDEPEEHIVYVHTPAMGSYTYHYGTVPSTLGSSYEPGRVLVTYFGSELCAAGIGAPVNLSIFGYLQGLSDWGYVYGWFQVVASGTYAPKDRFGYCGPYNEFHNAIPESTVDPTTVDPTTLHATQSLPVQWPRTPDGAVLETTTTINVTGGST